MASPSPDAPAEGVVNHELGKAQDNSLTAPVALSDASVGIEKKEATEPAVTQSATHETHDQPTTVLPIRDSVLEPEAKKPAGKKPIPVLSQQFTHSNTQDNAAKQLAHEEYQKRLKIREQRTLERLRMAAPQKEKESLQRFQKASLQPPYPLLTPYGDAADGEFEEASEVLTLPPPAHATQAKQEPQVNESAEHDLHKENCREIEKLRHDLKSCMRGAPTGPEPDQQNARIEHLQKQVESLKQDIAAAWAANPKQNPIQAESSAPSQQGQLICKDKGFKKGEKDGTRFPNLFPFKDGSLPILQVRLRMLKYGVGLLVGQCRFENSLRTTPQPVTATQIMGIEESPTYTILDQSPNQYAVGNAISIRRKPPTGPFLGSFPNAADRAAKDDEVKKPRKGFTESTTTTNNLESEIKEFNASATAMIAPETLARCRELEELKAANKRLTTDIASLQHMYQVNIRQLFVAQRELMEGTAHKKTQKETNHQKHLQLQEAEAREARLKFTLAEATEELVVERVTINGTLKNKNEQLTKEMKSLVAAHAQKCERYEVAIKENRKSLAQVTDEVMKQRKQIEEHVQANQRLRTGVSELVLRMEKEAKETSDNLLAKITKLQSENAILGSAHASERERLVEESAALKVTHARENQQLVEESAKLRARLEAENAGLKTHNQSLNDEIAELEEYGERLRADFREMEDEYEQRSEEFRLYKASYNDGKAHADFDRAARVTAYENLQTKFEQLKSDCQRLEAEKEQIIRERDADIAGQRETITAEMKNTAMQQNRELVQDLNVYKCQAHRLRTEVETLTVEHEKDCKSFQRTLEENCRQSNQQALEQDQKIKELKAEVKTNEAYKAQWENQYTELKMASEVLEHCKEELSTQNQQLAIQNKHIQTKLSEELQCTLHLQSECADKSLLIRDQEDLVEDVEELRARIHWLAIETERLTTKHMTYVKAYETQAHELHEKKSELCNVQKANAGLKNKIEELVDEDRKKSEYRAAGKKAGKRLQEELAGLKAINADLEESLEDLESERAELQTFIGVLAKEIVQYKTDFKSSAETHDSDIKEIKDRNEALKAEFYDLKIDGKRASAKLEEKREEMQMLVVKYQKCKQEFLDLKYLHDSGKGSKSSSTVSSEGEVFQVGNKACAFAFLKNEEKGTATETYAKKAAAEAMMSFKISKTTGGKVATETEEDGWVQLNMDESETI